MSFILTQPLRLVLLRGAQGLLWKLQFVDMDPALMEEAEAERKATAESPSAGCGLTQGVCWVLAKVGQGGLLLGLTAPSLTEA